MVGDQDKAQRGGRSCEPPRAVSVNDQGEVTILLTALTIAAAIDNPVKHYKPKNPGCRTPACDKRVGRWWWRHHRPPVPPRIRAGASWFNDSGGTACGTHYPLGVAHKTLPCGTRVELCASRCAIVVVEDRGPFIAGREWDLNPGAKAAIGFGDVGSVRYRVLR